ncbi:hypothetical protein [Litoreibacter roseus]|uniref:Uncharacterized protein n=1 Tax=Litoreibacter roseus TaxID=2601869 RepID=A0A6N6JL13_9RHOB|nr:hypothetical protein [Litoreibacter roseus]GFE66996.1 hypothetical protein KIN_40700 [Litoreibacter roseus]
MEDLKGIKNVKELVSRIETNPTLSTKLGEKPSEVLRAADDEIRANQDLPNNFIYQAAVVFVGATLIITVVGALSLIGFGKMTDTPEWVIALTSAGVGALAGMLRS